MRRLLRKLWPDTLTGQLLLALIGGLLAAQALTSTIWHDVRAHRALEIPTRVLATRVADLVALLNAKDVPPSVIDRLQSRDFTFRLSNTPSQPNPAAPTPLESDMRALFTHLLADRFSDRVSDQSSDQSSDRFSDPSTRQSSGSSSDPMADRAPDPLASPPGIRQFALQQMPTKSDVPAALSLDRLLRPSAIPDSRFSLELELDPGRWLTVEAREEQGWRITESWDVFLDYFLRIYLLRILLLVVVVLWAVRLVTRPILRLARAAQALEQDVGSPPMPVRGPVEVRHAAAAFNSMQSRLAAQLEERTRFLAAVSHDLRSPITRLRLRTEMLPESPVKARFNSDLEHMEAMVAATLKFVQSGEPREPRREIDIHSMLTSMQQDAADLGHDVALTGTSRRTLWGYPRSLRRCLDNLLENALRFGQHAKLEVTDAPDRLTILVRDDGPGIPEQDLARVTEPFYRVESSRNSATGGYGLGLSIARAVIESHAGRLTFHNGASGGFEVRVVLPRSPDATLSD